MFATDTAATAVANVGAAPINEPVDPASFSMWVWIVGAALLVLIAAWYWWVFYFTRERSAKDADGGRRDRYSGLRKETLDEVDAAEARYREGESDLRTLHLDLNHILREFANGRLRMDTSSLTVGEIATLEGTDRLSMLLEEYQEPAFASDSDAEALSATEDARGVIREW
ncbi:DUF4381 domain-containing protein [Occultella aeris]|uniref:DUF4381 domain-containing protein n=1 Tax=Occultella aeris TaxID=2761496 RepID=A0A7M4DEC0_9MICO|nr:DUF4381 family protein [Occultella aeris]VZO35234.1 hypothetical protein HALOF300_00460 [Occultella aeris]